ncbi:MAG: hypothetical protein HC886_21310 [Leptolyngbyaceae cyanobacterium SM1_1_3]|nr:hypothetical protein [Leptolyngbyaceae cyanobacterium SM1_1_3]
MANLDSDQLEQLQEIGTYLYQARQELSASLEEIATRIFIRPLLLRAIEEADPEPLPEPVFIQGFIRRYGDALGLDGLSLAKNFSVKTAVAHLSAATPTPYVDRPLPLRQQCLRSSRHRRQNAVRNPLNQRRYWQLELLLWLLWVPLSCCPVC